MQFTVPLALFGFLPVLLTGIGFFYIICLIFSVLPVQGRIAFWGGGLVILGGFLRAIWKLMMAVSGGSVDINWMEDSLFVFMAPGYILFTWSLWQLSRAVQGKRTSHVWILPFVFSILMLGISYYLRVALPDSPAWKWMLMTVAVLGNTISGLWLVVLAFRQKFSLSGWLFLVNLIGIFILNGFARMGEQSVRLHWMDESINLVIWLAFTVAARNLYHVHTNSVGKNSMLSQLAISK